MVAPALKCTAAAALAVLDPLQNTRGHAFRVHVLGLGGMILYARDELARVGRFAWSLVDKERAQHPYLH